MNTIFNKIALRRYHGHGHQTRKPCPIPGTSHIPRDGSYRIYKLLTYLVMFPAIAAVGVYTYKNHVEKECVKPPFIKLEYMRRRTKRFPWGDGNKSLFHNPEVNPLPDGYEEE